MVSPERRSEIMLSNIDKTDCGVIALQAVSHLNRKEAEQLLKAHGYSKESGTPRGAIEEALREIGIKTEQRSPIGETPATYAISHEYGSFLIYVERHVMALVNGDLHNSRGSWRVPCDGITEVTTDE